MVEEGLPALLRAARARGAVLMGIAEGAQVLGQSAAMDARPSARGGPRALPPLSGEGSESNGCVQYAGVVPVSVHIVSGGSGSGSGSGSGRVEAEWRPLTRLLCEHSGGGVSGGSSGGGGDGGDSGGGSSASGYSGGVGLLSGRGVALREGGGVLCFADGTLEALGVDAVAFDPLASPSAATATTTAAAAAATAATIATAPATVATPAAPATATGALTITMKRPNAKAKAKLRRTLLFAGAAVFSGASAAAAAPVAAAAAASFSANLSTSSAEDWPLWIGPSAVARLNVVGALQVESS
jgi:hypothetical protein